MLRIAFATDQLIDPDYEKASGEMEAVAADLTRQVRKYWHQNDHLRLTIDIEKVERYDGGGQRLLQLRVLDDRHYFTNNLSDDALFACPLLVWLDTAYWGLRLHDDFSPIGSSSLVVNRV